MERKYYLFKGTKATEQLEACIGESILRDSFCLVGRPFELREEGGCLFLLSNGVRIARTSALVGKSVFTGSPVEAPAAKAVKSGMVSASEMLVYRTQSGSEYVFVPEGAALQKLA